MTKDYKLKPLPISKSWQCYIPQTARVILGWNNPTFKVLPIIDEANDQIIFKRVKK